MNLLLDTHILLLAASAPDRLPAQAHRLIEDQATKLVYSAVSLLEVAIKNSLGRGRISRWTRACCDVDCWSTVTRSLL